MYRNGFISDPKCLGPDSTVSDVLAIKAKFGFAGVPITADGKMGSTLVGMVTNRDIDFVEDENTKLSQVSN